MGAHVVTATGENEIEFVLLAIEEEEDAADAGLACAVGGAHVLAEDGGRPAYPEAP